MPARSLRIGTLDTDLTAIAGAIHSLIHDGPQMVWIDDQRRAFVGDPNANPLIPTRWIVGTFGDGHSVGFIEDDLRAMAQERSHASMMD